MTECKDDSQQRGWAVHDDQQIIVEYLEELLQILVRMWVGGIVPVLEGEEYLLVRKGNFIDNTVFVIIMELPILMNC